MDGSVDWDEDSWSNATPDESDEEEEGGQGEDGSDASEGGAPELSDGPTVWDESEDSEAEVFVLN